MYSDDNVQVIEGDLQNPEHAGQFLRLTAAYMADPMGGATAWTDEQKETVIMEMKQQPGAIILFALQGNEYAGICTCFYTYSTFLAKPLLNIHDIYVTEGYRENGVGKKLIQKVEEIARKNNCGKITLEVRKDNLSARGLYKSQGYSEAPHSMFFWIKYI